MKLDLSNFIKGSQANNWTQDSFKDYLSNSLIEIIKLELESLPKDHWERTLQTWKRICHFCKNMMKKEEKERQKLYEKFGFDQMMIYTAESVIEKLSIAYSLGFMEEKDPPEKIIKIGLENLKDNSEIISFMKKFFEG